MLSCVLFAVGFILGCTVTLTILNAVVIEEDLEDPEKEEMNQEWEDQNKGYK